MFWFELDKRPDAIKFPTCDGVDDTVQSTIWKPFSAFTKLNQTLMKE